MSRVHDLMVGLARHDDCVIEPPAGLPRLGPGHALPADVELFYRLCGGLTPESVPIRIVATPQFLPINEVEFGRQYPNDPSSGWYVLADSYAWGFPQRVSIDLRPSYRGRCYDSFWDRHGIAGSMKVIATGFTAFLDQLVSTNEMYSTDSGFVGWGDAYDELEPT